MKCTTFSFNLKEYNFLGKIFVIRFDGYTEDNVIADSRYKVKYEYRKIID